MPALFAYLITVGILLGGGYGALSWLAAPEPVKVVAKAKPKPPSTHTASVAAPAPAQVSPPPQAVDSAVKQASNEKPKPSEPEARAVTHVQGASNDGAKPSPDQQGVVHAETAPPEAKQSLPTQEAAIEARQPDEQFKQDLKRESKQESGPEIKQANRRPIEAAPAINTVSSNAPVALAKPKRPSQRQASRPPERRALALMTLRTIEFPDGRRATMLIPYRDNRRAMAVDPDW